MGFSIKMCSLCFALCFFFLAFVNLLVKTAMTTKITFDEFVQPKPMFIVCDLTQVEFGILMSGTFELTDTKKIYFSLRSYLMKFSLRASFSTQNFDEKTCNIMYRF